MFTVQFTDWANSSQHFIRLLYTAALYLEAVFKLLADEVEDNGVYAGVDGCKVDAEVIQDQQETENKKQKKADYHCFVLDHWGNISFADAV